MQQSVSLGTEKEPGEPFSFLLEKFFTVMWLM